MADKRGLGRGLSALMGEEDAGPKLKAVDAPTAIAPHTDQLDIPVEHLEPNPYQPRRTFTEDDLKDLTASIKERGIIQPIIVRPKPGADGQFQIIAGERRWRAAQRAQLHDVPVRVLEFDDAQTLEIAIVENVQRADLNAVEEARGYRRLMDEFDYTQDALAKFIGKSRSHIANTLRLLSLPEGVQVMLADGRLSAGHARALVGHESAGTLALEIAKKGLSVRDAEVLAKKGLAKKGKAGKQAPAQKDADTRALEIRMSNKLGMKVEIEHKGEKGTLTVRYRSLEQLDDICKRLAK